uniref:Defect at low temperature protein 1 n=1 Tax=Blastobotrys adeninivorans TaxID=409370 RepID=A0A060SXM0_BLAAD
MNAVLYNITLFILAIILVGLLVVTPVDTILQSQSSGQFWNVIIIVCAYALTAALTVAISLARIWRTRKALNDVPRRYLPRADDLDPQSASLIRSEWERCQRIVQQTHPAARGARISHPGLLPPDSTEPGSGADVPYMAIISTMVSFIEQKATAIHDSFARPKGMHMREYISHLQDYGLITAPDADNAEKFVAIYEKVRFSGKLIHAADFSNLLQSCFRLLLSMKRPDTTVSSMSYLDTPSDDLVRVLSGSDSQDLARVLTRSELGIPFLNPLLDPRNSYTLSRYSSAISPLHTHASGATNQLEPTTSSTSSSDASVIYRPTM